MQPSGKCFGLPSSFTIPLSQQLLGFMTLLAVSEHVITPFTILAISLTTPTSTN